MPQAAHSPIALLFRFETCEPLRTKFSLRSQSDLSATKWSGVRFVVQLAQRRTELVSSSGSLALELSTIASLMCSQFFTGAPKTNKPRDRNASLRLGVVPIPCVVSLTSPISARTYVFNLFQPGYQWFVFGSQQRQTSGPNYKASSGNHCGIYTRRLE